jgi:hypothetical protein
MSHCSTFPRLQASLLLAAAGAALLVGGCRKTQVTSEEALKFHNFLREQHQRVEAAEKKFQRQLNEALETKDALPALQKAYKAYQRTIVDVNAETTETQRPGDASSTRYFRAYRGFLKERMELVEKRRSLVFLLDDGKLTDEERAKRVSALVDAIRAQDESSVRKFMDEQKTYARQHNLELKQASE